MEPRTKKRPTSVTVIAWIFIGLAALMILSGAMALAMFTFIKYSSGGAFAPPPSDELGPFGLAALLMEHFDLLALFQINIAVFIIISSIYFLKLRSWARTALEVVSWLGLTYVVGFSLFWIASWIFMSSSGPRGQGASAEPLIFGIFGAIMGIVVMAVYAAPLIAIIWFLRGKTIREACSRIED